MCKVHHVNTIYMTSEQLFSQIRSKRSFLCVGLDTDVNKIPRHLLSQDDPVFALPGDRRRDGSLCRLL